MIINLFLSTGQLRVETSCNCSKLFSILLEVVKRMISCQITLFFGGRESLQFARISLYF